MDKREQRKKLSFTNTQNIFDVLFWTTLAIVLGLVASFIFLPLLGVNPFYAVSVMFSETFSSTFNMGNILIKTVETKIVLSENLAEKVEIEVVE